MMNQKIKGKWIRALRSGLYRQGYGRLVDREDGEYCYCPLGVLVVIQGVPPDKLLHYSYPPIDCVGGLSVEAMFVIASASDGLALAPFVHKGMRKHSFKEIANYLEKEKGI
jgi:hypothetical protein